jgi:hypothetical protein
MQKTVRAIISALTGRKPSSLGNRPQETVSGNRREKIVESTVQPSVRLVINLETGTVKVKL